MDGQVFAETLLAWAQALANEVGVEVLIDENAMGFSTDSKTLKIPTIAMLSERFPIRSELETYFKGAIVHELGHIKRTNFGVRRQFRKAFEAHPMEHVAVAIGQYIEDAFIERQQSLDSDENRDAIASMWSLLFDKNTGQSIRLNSIRAFQEVIFYAARYSVLGDVKSTERLVAAVDSMRITSGDEMVQAVEAALARLPVVTTSDEGVEIATELLALVGITSVGKVEKPEVAEHPDDLLLRLLAADSEENADVLEAEPKSPGQRESDDGEITEHIDFDEADSNSDIAPIGGAGADGDPVAASAVAIQEISQALPEGVKFLTIMKRGGSGLASVAIQPDVTAGMKLRDTVLNYTMMANSRLASLLNAQAESEKTFALRGRVVPKRLWKMRTGNFHVFKQIKHGIEQNSAIKVLLDRSGSMSDDIARAIQAAVFLPLTFDSVDGIQTSISVFPGQTKTSQTLKTFDQSITSTIDVLAKVSASGGTPMDSAISTEGDDLLQVDVSRRILIVITDGMPDGGHDGKQRVKKRISQLKAQGVSVFGIGIGLNLSDVFEQFVCVNHVSELTDKLYDLMLKNLVELPLAA
jgi:Mg-chelatase subunit ChlD